MSPNFFLLFLIIYMNIRLKSARHPNTVGISSIHFFYVIVLLIYLYLYYIRLNKFLTPIKLGIFKFCPYLFLMVFLVPTKKLLISLVPAKTKFV